MVGSDLAKVVEQLKSTQDLGFTHASVVIMNQGLQPHEHVDAIAVHGHRWVSPILRRNRVGPDQHHQNEVTDSS